VKPAPFAYARARSVAHAIDLLREEEARLLAGGQTLVATLNMRLDRPRLLIDINAIPELDRISLHDGSGDRHDSQQVQIGALVRHAQAERSSEIARWAPLIALAIPHVGHPAVRNRGTIGGSIAFADPAAELPACLVALNGEVEIAGAEGGRKVQAEDFFQALFQTALGPRDVLTSIRVPAANAQSRVGFAEFARRHGDYAMIGLAACARAQGSGLADVRLAYFGAGPVPVRARNAETALGAGDLEAAVAALRSDLHPHDDLQASAAVKRHLAGVLLRRVASQLMTSRPAGQPS